MEDKYGKYVQLTFNLFFTFIGFIVTLIILLLGLRLFFGLVDQLTWFVYLYMLLILLVPPALFITIYWIYLRRTANHISKPIKIISYILLSAALLAWIIFLVVDVTHFFKTSELQIKNYYSYNVLFLFINVVCIFFVGIIQALSGAKEKDWLEKHRDSAADNEIIY